MLPGPRIRPTRAEVDLGTIVDNARVLAGIAPLFAVVKADAYGYGAVPVSQAIESSSSAHALAVSLVEEGIELREAGIKMPVLVMGPAMAGGGEAMVRNDLMPMISDLGALEEVIAAAVAQDRDVAVHLKVDTGMGRLGLVGRDVDRAMDAIATCRRSRLAGIASHLACADDDATIGPSMTRTQLERFTALRSRIKTPDIRWHLANSAGALRFPEAALSGERPHAIRVGLALYGAGPATEDARFASAMRLVSSVSQLRDVARGEVVGYGATWRAERDSRLAVVAVGYADGYPRSLSNRAQVLIRGVRAPVVGLVSMDMSVIDVTEISEISVGDEVVLLGVQGDDEISVAEVARHAQLTEYEVTCGISKRVPRDYR